jgi:HAD superfamily hydrolase (TIGR01549 family)
MTRKTEALIFDIDGTLVDSNDLHAAAWQEAFRHFGVEFPYTTIREQMGKGGDLLVPDLLDVWQMRKFGEELREYRKKLFRREYLKRVKPFDGVRQTLEILRARDIKLVLASSSDEEEVKHYIELLGIEDLLEGSTSKSDAQFSKPSPEIFQAALERAGNPKRAAAVGDTPYDITAAHRCALPIIAVRSGGFPDDTLAVAEMLLNDIRDVPGKMKAIDEWWSRE